MEPNMPHSEEQLLFTILQLEQARLAAEETIRDLTKRLQTTTSERDAALGRLAIIFATVAPYATPPSTSSVTTNNSHQLQASPLPSSYLASPVPFGSNASRLTAGSNSPQLSTPSPTVPFLKRSFSLSPQELLSCTRTPAAQCHNSVAGNDYADTVIDQLASRRPLPKKGKLSEAMSQTAPLLSSLLNGVESPKRRNNPSLVQPLRAIPPAAGNPSDMKSGLSRSKKQRTQDSASPSSSAVQTPWAISPSSLSFLTNTESKLQLSAEATQQTKLEDQQR